MAEPQSSQLKKGSCFDRIPCVMKIVNLISAGILIGFGVAGIVILTINHITSAKFFMIFSPIFMTLVGFLFVAAQFRVACILKHFLFLKAYFGRGVFNMFMASSVFYFFSCDFDNTVVAWIAAVLIFVTGIFYIIAGTCLQKIFQIPEQAVKQVRQDLIT